MAPRNVSDARLGGVMRALVSGLFPVVFFKSGNQSLYFTVCLAYFDDLHMSV